MDSKEFTENALKTEHTPKRLNMSRMALIAALQMAINCSDVMDQIKKLIIYGKPADLDKMSAQIGEMAISAEFFHDFLGRNDDITVWDVNNDDVNLRLLHAAIGMFTESGEMLEALLKQLNGAPLDKVNFAEELADSDWYKAIAHDELGITEEQARAAVIKKLQVRYPQKFTSEAALNRNLDREREVLEQYNGKFPQGVLQTDSAMLQGE